jgi:hypothetical protein
MNDHIKGKLQELFGLPHKLIPKAKYLYKTLETRLNESKVVKTTKQFGKKSVMMNPHEEIHKIVIDLFGSEYYPIISKNIRIDEFNTTIIMGGVSYNMNIPNKMGFLKLDTDDFDLKIYTTSINYTNKDINKSEKEIPKQTQEQRKKMKENMEAVNKVLSVFKFSVLVICMYLKQIFYLLNTFTKTDKEKDKEKDKDKDKEKDKVDLQSVIKNYELQVQFKKKPKNAKIFELIETIDITKLSYTELYSKIINSINNVDLLITNKITYEIKPGKTRNITFSDCKIVYSSIESPAFYSHYLESNELEVNKSLEQLINTRIPVSKIMDMNSCSNNCRFMSIKSLLIDTVIMLSYADLLVYEKLESGGEILVPAGFIFKYYKYLAKFIRLLVIKKFNSGKLQGSFFESAKALWQYALTDVRRKAAQLKANLDEYDKINITYKAFLNEFHQNLFHNRTILIKQYPILLEIAEEYERIVFFINRSRHLFRELNTISHNDTIESVAIQFAEKEMSKSKSLSTIVSNIMSKTLSSGGSSGGGIDHNNKSGSRTGSRSIILTNDNHSYNDIEPHQINLGSKIRKLMKDEINFYSKLQSFTKYPNKKTKKTVSIK